MNIVYEGPISPRVGGGMLHFTGLSSALSRRGVLVTEVLPRPTQATGDTGAYRRVSLPVAGPRPVQLAVYEMLRVLLCVWWTLRGRRFDVWMSRYSLFGVGLVFARLVAKKVVLEINGPPYEEMLANFGSKTAAALALGSLRLQLRSAHGGVAVTPRLAEYARAHVPGTAVVAIQNGAHPVDATHDYATERDVDFLFAGAFTPWYELGVVLRAIARVRDGRVGLCVRLVGDGIERDQMHGLVEELGLRDVVEFVGWIDPGQLDRELARARVGLLPLRSKGATSAIGSPLKLYYYIAAGLTVVGTRVDGISNSPVSDAVHYYEQGDVRSCADVLRQSLDSTAQTVDTGAWTWDSRAQQLLEAVASTVPSHSHSSGGRAAGSKRESRVAAAR